MPPAANPLYLAGKNATATITPLATVANPTPVPAILAVEDGTVRRTCGKDEVTNTLSMGFYEQVATIRSWTGSLQLVYIGNIPPSFQEGDTINLSITIPNGPAISGNVFVDTMEFRTVTVKGAVRYTFDYSSNGAYTGVGIS